MSTFEKVVKIISESYDMNVEKITADTQLADDLHLDSLDMYEKIVEIEDEFNITIPEAKLDNLETIGDVIELIDAICKEE